MVAQGDIWWTDRGPGSGARLGAYRPVVVVQGDSFNRSRLATVLAVPLTTNLERARFPGNVMLESASTGLPKDSVANVSQIWTVQKSELQQRSGRVTNAKLQLILAGIDIMLGRRKKEKPGG